MVLLCFAMFGASVAAELKPIPKSDLSAASCTKPTLVKRASIARCFLNVSFGCDADSGTVWTANCRGVFRCNEGDAHTVFTIVAAIGRRNARPR